MITYRSAGGPFPERPFYKLSEIEEICTEALRSTALYPEQPGPVRIERFVEKRFGVQVVYKDLPPGLLGYTRFGERGVEEIAVSRSLVEEGTEIAERRVNTTLAHEGGHGLLQAHLFAFGLEQGASLFEGQVDSSVPKILCKEEAVVPPGLKGRKVYDGRWWEFQANQAMGALLLPRPLILECLSPLLVARGTFGVPVLDPGRREAAARLLADTFAVNPVVARIRLSSMYPEGSDAQLTL